MTRFTTTGRINPDVPPAAWPYAPSPLRAADPANDYWITNIGSRAVHVEEPLPVAPSLIVRVCDAIYRPVVLIGLLGFGLWFVR